jgi:hypothetical protein
MSDNKPPCECIESVNGRWTYRCECSNGGDAEGAAYWVAYENARIGTADTITRLTADNKRLRAALRECKAELNAYYRMEYPSDHPYSQKKLAQAMASNPATVALKENNNDQG